MPTAGSTPSVPRPPTRILHRQPEDASHITLARRSAQACRVCQRSTSMCINGYPPPCARPQVPPSVAPNHTSNLRHVIQDKVRIYLEAQLLEEPAKRQCEETGQQPSINETNKAKSPKPPPSPPTTQFSRGISTGYQERQCAAEHRWPCKTKYLAIYRPCQH